MRNICQIITSWGGGGGEYNSLIFNNLDKEGGKS